MCNELSSQPSRNDRRRRALGATACILVVIACCVICFLAGRLTEQRAKEPTAQVDAAPQSVKVVDAPEPANKSDDKNKCEEILRLKQQVTQLNWKLVTPFYQYQAGNVDAEELRRQTAEPEEAILRLATRMCELANDIDDTTLRRRILELTTAVLQRQRGFSMMIEGIVRGDESRLSQGEKLFEEGRNKAIAAVVSLDDSDSPEAVHLRRLLDAYESGDKQP
jgi:hypothetical protein